jgi:Amt family ammonium transporter
VLAYSGIATLIIAFFVKVAVGLRVGDEDEVTGIDETEHAESGYDFSTLRGGGGLGTPRPHTAETSTSSARDHVPATAGKES